jgi:formylglycine-generating enzyme required for sulfatase activity
VSWERSARGYRLPTEAEWEYAARAGEGHVYAGSGSPGAVAWYSQNSGDKTNRVAGKQANAWGLYDMSGNVMEWVWDRYEPYYGGSTTDPSGSDSEVYRVNRGGPWAGPAHHVRLACRNTGEPSDHYEVLGLRLVRTSP